jgi:hypothetical protein
MRGWFISRSARPTLHPLSHLLFFIFEGEVSHLRSKANEPAVRCLLRYPLFCIPVNFYAVSLLSLGATLCHVFCHAAVSAAQKTRQPLQGRVI